MDPRFIYSNKILRQQLPGAGNEYSHCRSETYSSELSQNLVNE